MAHRSLALPPVEKLGFDELYRQIEELPQGVTGEILSPGVLKTMGRPGWPHQQRGRSDCFVRSGAAIAATVAPGGGSVSSSRCACPGSTSSYPTSPGRGSSAARNHRRAIRSRCFRDWVCEVHSASTRSDDRHLKLPVYARAGIPHIWLVDPEAQLVEVYVPSDGQPKLVASAVADDAPSLAPFDLEMPLTYFWQDPPPVEPSEPRSPQK